MSSEKNKTIKYVLKILPWIAGFAIFVFIVIKVKGSNLLFAVREIHPVYLAAALFLFVIVYCLIAYRLMRLSFMPLDYVKILDIWVKSTLLSYISGFRGAAFGARVGLLKLKGGKTSSSLAGVSSELLYDASFAFIITLIFLIINRNLLQQKLPCLLDVRIIAPLLIAVFLFLMVYLYYGKSSFVKKYISKMSRSFRSANLPVNVGLSLIIWGCNAFVLSLFVRAAGYEINFWVNLAAVCTGWMVGLLSFIPGGLGVSELTGSYVLLLHGMPLDTALTITVIMRVINILSAVGILIFINLFFTKRLKGILDVV